MEGGERERKRELDSWCFEPSQPQRITSELERERELVGAMSPVDHRGESFIGFERPVNHTESPQDDKVLP